MRLAESEEKPLFKGIATFRNPSSIKGFRSTISSTFSFRKHVMPIIDIVQLS